MGFTFSALFWPKNSGYPYMVASVHTLTRSSLFWSISSNIRFILTHGLNNTGIFLVSAFEKFQKKYIPQNLNAENVTKTLIGPSLLSLLP